MLVNPIYNVHVYNNIYKRFVSATVPVFPFCQYFSSAAALEVHPTSSSDHVDSHQVSGG